MVKTFADKAYNFLCNTTLGYDVPDDVEVISIYDDPQVRKHLYNFLHNFFSDTHKRILVLGINPGRIGTGVTGIPFTDTDTLSRICGINHNLAIRTELSSQFMYRCIEKFGGVRTFYNRFFLSAVSPVGFTKDGKNFNYYDDSVFLSSIMSFLKETLQQQLKLGVYNTVVILGTGKNKIIFQNINNELALFRNVFFLEHPRYIMQYKRKNLEYYTQKYIDTFWQAIKLADNYS